MVERFYSSLADIVLKRRLPIILLYALMSAALGWLGARIVLKADIADLLPSNAPSARDLRFYLDTFGSTNPVFVTISLAEGNPEEPLETFEEASGRIVSALDATGLFTSIRYGVDERESFDALGRSLEHLPILVPPDKLDDLRRRVEPAAITRSLADLKRRASGLLMIGPAKQMAATDPLGLLSLLPLAGRVAQGPIRVDPGTGLFLSDDGESLLVLAIPLKPPHDVDFSYRLMAALDRIIEETTRSMPEVVIRHAGGYLFAVQDEGRIRHDITSTAAISITVITALFALVLRRLSLLAILMVPLALSTVWTLGVASIYPGHLNVVTVAFAAILLGMGDDSLTHLYLRHREVVATGADRAVALRAALVSTGPSILLATLTSGLAFASLTFVEFRGLSELGVIAAAGMLNLLVCALVLFPCLLSMGRTSASSAAAPILPMEPFVRFHTWAARRRPLVLATVGIVVAAAGAAAMRLEFSSDLRGLRGDDPAGETLENVLAPFGGALDPVHLISRGTDAESARRGAEALGPVCRVLQEEGLIDGFANPTDWLPSDTSQRARFDAAGVIDWDRVAADLRASAAALDLRDEFFAPFLDVVSHYGDFERVRLKPSQQFETGGSGPSLVSADAVGVTLFPAPGTDPVQIVSRARALSPDAVIRAASLDLVVSDLVRIIEQDFRRASILALAAVGIIALAAFRRPSTLLLVACPVLIGCVIMLGGLALLGIPINLMNLVATPLVFGLGIDFGIYMVNRHAEEGCSDVPKVLRHTGGAILLTGLTTLAGFGALLSADFAGLRSMGWVAVLGIGGCLLSALLILPLLLPRPRQVRPAA